jgi:hypothetical protein
MNELQTVSIEELRQVEGGEVTTAAIVGAVALGGAAVVGVIVVGGLLGWGLYELTK